MAGLLEFVARLFAPGTGLSVLWHTVSPSATWSGGASGLVALAGLAGAIGLVAVAAAAVVRSVAALAASLRARAVWSSPLQPAAGWLLQSQSDPDADGRPRPRAPGISLPAA
ncbi:DUF6412 domain-containing protein [Leifsonia shinshuensis]|uniref:Uncharacterized protein n=1 Tax=Leifsonia shinshuensis TaxID=150026 RepID=A0A853CYM9_9MICO|nr:DUF6412 domain-containing protein [Leifsonia shinshuensis]NYJ24294.1 hypothetical protein [Leifsonia shinshuensis]